MLIGYLVPIGKIPLESAFRSNGMETKQGKTFEKCFEIANSVPKALWSCETPFGS